MASNFTRKKFQPPFKRRDVGTKLLPVLLARLDGGLDNNCDLVKDDEIIYRHILPEKKPRLEIIDENQSLTILKPILNCEVEDIEVVVEAGPSEMTSEVLNKEDSSLKLYYSVLWGKQTTKKHKTWESDGILEIDGKILTLKSGNKIIGSASGVKLPDEIIQGTLIKIGGKELEIQEKIDKFPLNEEVTEYNILPLKILPTKMISKPFIFPGTPDVNNENVNIKFTKGKPLFDPTASNALIMPDPEHNHQLLYNQAKLDIVPVVVDPHISKYLRQHQRDGVTFLYKCMQSVEFASGCGAILADEMGLGKTLQTIAVLWTLMRQSPYYGKKEIKRALIVTPSSLVKSWEKEFYHWLGPERIRLYGVDSAHPLIKCPPQYPVIIISYDMITRSEDIIKQMKFDILVCDEAHKLKNKNGQANLLLSSINCRRRILLTGTPIQNDLSELYALVNLAIPSVLGKDSDFVKEYEIPIGKIQDTNCTPLDKQIGELKALELNGLLAKFVLRRNHNVMLSYLPPRVTHIIFCKPTDLQRIIYKELLEMSMEKYTTLSVILALKKLCNHPNLVHFKNNPDGSEIYNKITKFPISHCHDLFLINQSGKLMVLVSLLNSFRQEKLKVVLVSHYTQTLNFLEDICKMSSFPFKRLDGCVSSKLRQNIVDSFNSEHGDSFVFLLSSKAGGVGLNLQGASRIILYDIDWNPAHDIQAMARCWRPGQTKITLIYRLITTGTIEERIYQRQIKKQDLGGSVMDLIVDNPTVISPEEYKDIFSLYTKDRCLTHDLLECHCDQNGLNQLNNVQNDTSSKKKNEFLGELQKWEHFGPPYTESNLDTAITSAGNNISFVFRSRIEKPKDENFQLESSIPE